MLNFKKMSKWAIVLGAFIVMLFIVGFITNPQQNPSENENLNPFDYQEIVQPDALEETRTPLSTPESSTASPSADETASTGDISVSITSDYVLAEKTYSKHTEVSFTDKETVGTIVGCFQNLMESSIEIPSRPEVGSYLFTISISNDEGTITYRFSAPQEDGTLYCKDLSTSEWSSMTGWIQVSEAGVYDYVKNLIENSAAS